VCIGEVPHLRRQAAVPSRDSRSTGRFPNGGRHTVLGSHVGGQLGIRGSGMVAEASLHASQVCLRKLLLRPEAGRGSDSDGGQTIGHMSHGSKAEPSSDDTVSAA